MSQRSLRWMWLGMAAVLGLGVGLLWSQVRFDHKVRNDFFAGFMGDQAALERAMKACEFTLAENPKHAEAMVWHGGGIYFLAGRAFQQGDPKKGMELAMRGLKEMDDAVALEPDNIGVRIPRGATLLGATRSPGNNDRSLLLKGLADFERTLEIQKEYFSNLGVHPRGELLFGLAEGWWRAGDEDKARGYFERIAKELSGSPYAKRAAIWIEKKSLPANQTGCIGCHSN